MERKPMFSGSRGKTARSETFAIKVASYDTSVTPNVVKGHRVDTGAEVTVFLRDINYNQTGRFSRSEIKDFAAPRLDRQHPGTAAGGTLLVQEAIPNGKDTFGARWITSLSHTEGEAEVFHATVHVTHVKYGKKSKQYPGGRPYALMTMLHDGNFDNLSEDMQNALKLVPPFKVESVAELKEAIKTLLDDQIGVGVRVSNADGFDAMYVKKQGDETDAALETFMGNIADMTEAIDSGELSCEVVPYGNVWAGPATTEIMAKNKVVLGRLKHYNEQGVGKNETPYSIMVFRSSIVAARLTAPDEHGNRAVFFSHFEPLLANNPVHGLVNAIAYAQTEHLAPEVPRIEPAAKPAAAAAQQPGGEAPESGHGNFDGGMPADDAPLMDGLDDDVGMDSAPASAPAPAQIAATQQGRTSRYTSRRA